MFAGGDQHGVLDGVQDDLRIDAFFLAQDLDGLKDGFQSALVLTLEFLAVLGLPAGLPLELQVGLLDLRRRGTRRGVWPAGLERDAAILETGQRAFPVAPSLHRLAQRDFGLLALEAHESRRGLTSLRSTPGELTSSV